MWNYAKAYAIIQIEGLSLERFLSLAVRKGITLRDVKRTGPKLLVLTAAASQLSELVSIADYTRVNLIVLKRGGLRCFGDGCGNAKSCSWVRPRDCLPFAYFPPDCGSSA